MFEFGRDVLDLILETILGFFQIIFNWVYDFIFEDLANLFSTVGEDIFSFFCNIFSGDIFSFDILYYILGLIVALFIFKLVIRIIRG